MKPTRIRVKKKGKWLDIDEIEPLPAPVEPPVVIVDELPDRQLLDPDLALVQLWYEVPQVRFYVTKKRRVREGLTPDQRRTAEAILARYGDQT